jgi:hypothetical protein
LFLKSSPLKSLLLVWQEGQQESNKWISTSWIWFVGSSVITNMSKYLLALSEERSLVPSVVIMLEHVSLLIVYPMLECPMRECLIMQEN